MEFDQAIRVCFQKYATFSGRAQRSEFWWFALFSMVGSLVVGLLDSVLLKAATDDIGPLSSIFSLVMLLPSISVAVRRLHDIDKSGWWWWLWLVPLVGWIILIVWYASVGTAGSNDYGPDPLGGSDGDDSGDLDEGSTYTRTSIPSVRRD